MALHCHHLEAFLPSKEVGTREKHDYGSGYAENAMYKFTIRITYLLPFKQITASLGSVKLINMLCNTRAVTVWDGY